MGIYMFGVIETTEKPTFGSVELEGKERKIYTLQRGQEAMVVAEAPMQIYDPTRKNLRAHQDTVARVMEEYDVIPMSFGNVLEDQKEVFALMEKLKDQFDEIFPKIRGKMEVGLKIIGKKEWLNEQIRQEPGMEDLRKKTDTKGKNASYYERMQLGESAQKFMIRLHERFEEEVFQPLAQIANAAKSNEVINERMLLNAAFLIDKENEEDFDAKVNEIFNEWNEHADFKYTGPWPAYNFIDLKIKAGNSV
ncbi:GvpL/GvpF family gas vesicle protein [uncultured Marinococcus sp.]|uniref:GvpL/GvpF family gas vesicle protein n=1 Tax=uncultured Marinococcus sp. TaxID=487012 RepID=UPI00261D2668|nr:GvpL/GvpF family gas vesicle protein [uncultured Marinococcus sp.]